MSVFGITENFGFTLIDFASQTWHTDEYNNWRKLDSLLTGIASTAPFTTDTGAADAYVVDYDPVIAAYTDGLELAFNAANANTGASTINVNSLGLKDIKVQGAALSAGNIPANGFIKIIYNGDHFELVEPKIIDLDIADGSVTPAKLSVGAPAWDGSGNLTTDGSITSDSFVKATQVKSDTDQVFFRQANNTYTSGTITFSTADPSGGNDGDIWFKYTA